MIVYFYLCIYGLPAMLASAPGLCALSMQRRVLGWLLVAGGVFVTIPGVIIFDRMRTRAMTEAGLVADDWPVSFVMPFVFGVLYFLVATIVCAAWIALIKRSKPQVG